MIKVEYNYSVLMSVYHNEKPEFLSLAIESILNQSLKTDDFVIICDGPLTKQLDNVLENFAKSNSCIHIFRLDKNNGLGFALNFGIQKCQNEIIMRMDSDDYSLPFRAEKQIKIINDGADITSGAIAEFVDDYRNTDGIRKVPLNRKEMKNFIKKRSPFNHPCVMYKKSLITSVGNYHNLLFLEDYDLWIRIYLSKCKIQNTDDVLVYMRVGNGLIDRRFSKQAKSSRKFIRKLLLKTKIINHFEFCLYSLAEFIINITPKWFKKWFYRSILRK